MSRGQAGTGAVRLKAKLGQGLYVSRPSWDRGCTSRVKPGTVCHEAKLGQGLYVSRPSWDRGCTSKAKLGQGLYV